MYYRKLVTDGLYLSPCDITNEVKIMTKAMNEDEELAYYNGFYEGVCNEDTVLELLTKWSSGPMFFSIVNDNDEFMGHISLYNQDHHEQFATLSIYLLKPYRHKGYAKKALKLITDFAFNVKRYNAIHLEVFSFNDHAYKVYEQFGFKKCGTYHNVRYHMGKSYDLILMEYLRSDS